MIPVSLSPLIARLDLPADYNGEELVLGWRSINPDGTSRNGYRWPDPGNWTPKRTPTEPMWRAPTGYTSPERGRERHRPGRSERRCWSPTDPAMSPTSTLTRCVSIRRWSSPGSILSPNPRRMDGRRQPPGADLWGANLRDADLRGADLLGAPTSRGADLRDADLWGATSGRLPPAYLGAPTSGRRPPGAPTSGTPYLAGADLGGANLGGADLRAPTSGRQPRAADLWDASRKQAHRLA